MKINSYNSFNTTIKNKLGLSEILLLISVLAISIIGIILSILFVSNIISFLPFCITIGFIFFILTIVSLSLIISSFIKSKEISEKAPEKISEIILKPTPIPKLEPTILSIPLKYNDLFFEESGFIDSLIIDGLDLRVKFLEDLSLEEIDSIDINISEDVLLFDVKENVKNDLKNWIENKVENNIFLDLFSPIGDGNCLFSAFRESMNYSQSLKKIPSTQELREEAINFLKRNILKDDLCLIYVLYDLIDFLLLENSRLNEEKVNKLISKCSFLIEALSENLSTLHVSENNVTSILKSSSEKNIISPSFLLKFLDLHLKDKVFCGPSVIYALSQCYNTTIFFYMKPPLFNSKLMLSIGVEQGDLFFHDTLDDSIGCSGDSWKKDIIIFNSEAKSQAPIYLGLSQNHFVVLKMGNQRIEAYF